MQGSKLKIFVFSILPALFLFASAEGLIRAFGWDRPQLYSAPTGDPFNGPARRDVDLIWSLKPNYRVKIEDILYETNSLGLRSPAVGPKKDGEFRILSLGESTTFGMRVEARQTYSAQLQKLLNQAAPGGGAKEKHPDYRVINAGVSAYSSTQSLQYLKLRGLKLAPDMVLFYHEVNDYLPTTVRDTGNHELGISLTDRQLIQALHHKVSRRLYQVSAVYRLLRNFFARYRIQTFQRDSFQDPYQRIGHPPGHTGPVVRRADTRKPVQEGAQQVPSRVSEAERRENLAELAALCRRRGIFLVVIHPSYAASVRHDCLLTEFCRSNGVFMFEAYDCLHPADAPEKSMFLDAWHPTAEGHLRLAAGLAQAIRNIGEKRGQ